MADKFCPDCGVTMDLHDLTLLDPCEDAEALAEALERMERMMFGRFVR